MWQLWTSAATGLIQYCVHFWLGRSALSTVQVLEYRQLVVALHLAYFGISTQMKEEEECVTPLAWCGLRADIGSIVR